MRKLLFLIAFFMLSYVGYSQTCPTPTGTGVYVMLDSLYKIAPSTAQKTNVGLCYYNNSGTAITAVQFRVFYDKNAFSNATVSLIGSTTNLDLQYITNTSLGYITITLSYTGPSATYTIANGERFLITFTHVPAATFNNLASISPLTWTGAQTFTSYAAKQNGMDTTLSVHNYGGVFTPVNFAYHGTFTNVTGTPAKNLKLALERRPLGGNTWTQHSVYTTNNSGHFNISVPLDTTYWDVRLAVQGDTMGVGNVISSTDRSEEHTSELQSH